jgi:hypothetical protein
MMFRSSLLPLLALAFTATSLSVQAQPKPRTQKPTLSHAVGLNELKIEMAETRLKVNSSLEAIIDLMIPLEDYLNANCMGKLAQSLTYGGNPSDPTCIARMQRILELNPGNPVGLCVRDGITAQSCVEAYQNQSTEVFVGDPNQGTVDPAMKVGLSASDQNKIAKLEETIRTIDAKYQEAPNIEEKRALIKDAIVQYDQAMSIACRLTSVSLQPRSSDGESGEDPEVAKARAKLLQVPPGIRGDYQREMAQQIDVELSAPATTKERREVLLQVQKVIENPEAPVAMNASNSRRVRFILSKCNELAKKAQKITPESPTATCHLSGWLSPQCIAAVKRWHAIKQREENLARGADAAKATKPSIISTF